MEGGKKSVVKRPVVKRSVAKRSVVKRSVAKPKLNPFAKLKHVAKSKISEVRRLERAPTFSKIMEPPKTKFKLRNVLQAIVGATVLAIPIGFTEETWRLGEILPMWNIVAIFFISILFISLFAYRHFKKNVHNFYWHHLVKRIVIIYLLSFIVVAIILFVIQKAPWATDIVLAFKRTIIVTLPSALGATIAGSLK